jgi:hypothetical protein
MAFIHSGCFFFPLYQSFNRQGDDVTDIDPDMLLQTGIKLGAAQMDLAFNTTRGQK